MIKKIVISVYSVLFILVGISFYVEANKKQANEIIEEEVIVEEIDNHEDYYDKLNKICIDNEVLGLQVVAFKGEQIVDSFNYGLADKDSALKVDDNTTFRIASTSKMISNMVIMKLVEEGKISLNSKINELTGLAYDKDVELKHILTHTSGVTGSEQSYDYYNVYDINEVIKSATSYKPGQKYSYSNLAAGTIAAIVERLTNERFYDYSKKVLFDELGLNAAYLVEDLNEGTIVATMYDEESGNCNPNTWMFNKNFYSSFKLGEQYRLAHANLYISASDLAKLGMVLAGDGTYNDKPILKKSTLEDIRKIYDEAEGQNYKAGLNTDIFMDFVDGKIVFGHTGSAYNALSCLIYSPFDHTGVVVITNNAKNIKNEKGYCSLLYDSVNACYDEFFK